MGLFGGILRIFQKERAVSLEKAQKIDENLKKSIGEFRKKFVEYESSEMYEIQQAQMHCASKRASTKAIETELIDAGETIAVEEKVIFQLAKAKQIYGALKDFASRDWKNTKPQEVITDLTIASDALLAAENFGMKAGALVAAAPTLGNVEGKLLAVAGAKRKAMRKRIADMKNLLKTRDPYSLRKSLNDLMKDLEKVVEKIVRPDQDSLEGSKQAKIFFEDYADQEHALANAAILGRQSLIDLKKCGVKIPNSLLNELNRVARYHRLARNTLKRIKV